MVDSFDLPERMRTPLLLQRFGEGDGEAYRALYERYRKPLLGFLRNHMDQALRREISEDDLLQEVHLEALGALHRFSYRRDLAFFFWLCGIARRRIHNHCRRLRRQPPPASLHRPAAGGVSSADLLRTLKATGGDPLEDLRLRENLALLAAALETLSEADRRAVVLRYVEEVPGPEAAALEGVSSGAFRVRLSRAVVRLRQTLDQLLETPPEAGR